MFGGEAWSDMDPPADKAAVDRLVREHLAGAIRFATRLTGNVDAAEELVQEALVRVARSWRSYRGEAQFRTWLWRILVNVFRDGLRAKRPAEELTVDLVDKRGIDPAESAENVELGQEIARCVSGLPPRQREVLVLSVYEGMTASQVSEVLSIAESNVYSTLYVARQRLARDLADYLAAK